MRAVTPGYPFRPRGKERGGLTLARPAPVCIGTTRPLPPPASSRLAGGILILLDQDVKTIRQASDPKVEPTFGTNLMLTPNDGASFGAENRFPLFRTMGYRGTRVYTSTRSLRGTLDPWPIRSPTSPDSSPVCSGAKLKHP